MRFTRLRLLASLCCGAMLLISGCSGENPVAVHKAGRVLMGTVVEVLVPGKDEKARVATEAAFAEMKRVEDLSSFHKASDLTKLNDAAGHRPVKVDRELLELLSEATRYSRETNGTFDVTVGALTRLWQFSAAEPRVPTPAEIERALPTVGWERLQVDVEAGTAFLPDPGAAIDLGGIAKGYALDRAAEAVRKSGVPGALINAGGDIVAIGEKEPGKPWRVGVKDPRDPNGIVAVVSVRDGVVVTSGDYERFLIQDGKRYHHILDPKTGYPGQGMQSVTIVGGDATSATVLAKAVFLMGVEDGLKLLTSFPGREALLVDAQGSMHFSPGGEQLFEMRRR